MNSITFLVCGTPANYRETIDNLKKSSAQANERDNSYAKKLKDEISAWKNNKEVCSKLATFSTGIALASPIIYFLVNRISVVAGVILLALAFRNLALTRMSQASSNSLTCTVPYYYRPTISQNVQNQINAIQQANMREGQRKLNAEKQRLLTRL